MQSLIPESGSLLMERATTGRPVLLLTLVLCTCTKSNDQSSSHSFRMYEEDGVSIAVTSSIPKYSAPLFNFEEMIQLRQDEERPESLMYRTTAFTRGDDGRYYVTDQGNSRIAVFGADGEFLHSIGREGEGPGEFRYPMLMFVKDGEVAVYDSRLRRTSIFNYDGTLQRTINCIWGSSTTIYMYPLPGERLALLSVKLLSADPEEMKLQYEVLTITADGDTLGLVESTPIGIGRNIYLPKYQTSITATPYFDTQSIAMYCPDIGVISYSNDEPVLYWYDLNGRLERELRIELEPEPVTDEEKRGIQRELQAYIDDAEDERSLARAEARKRHAIIPDTKAFWDYVTVDDYGYHWIMYFPDYTAPEPPEEQPLRFRLLSPQGEYLGDVEFPTRNARVSRGYLLATKENETTGETIHLVYQMTPAVRGFTYPQ